MKLVKTIPGANPARIVGLAVFGLLLMALLTAAAEPAPLHKANYKQALHFNSSFIKQFTYDTSVNPTWIGKSESFWYAYKTSHGTRYWRVDPKKPEKKLLFNHSELAMQLAEQMQKPVDAAQLSLGRLEVNEEGTKFKFTSDGNEFEYDLAGEKLKKLGKAESRPGGPGGAFGPGGQGGKRSFQGNQFQGKQKTGDQKGGFKSQARSQDYRVLSPDKKSYVFSRNHNLFLVNDAPKELSFPSPCGRLNLPST